MALDKTPLDGTNTNTNTNNGASLTEELTQTLMNNGLGGDAMQDFSTDGLLILGNLVNGSTEKHYSRMAAILEPFKINALAITQNLDFPLIVYSVVEGGTIYYYPTIVVDDTKKGPTISNFLASLKNKENGGGVIYTPDTKFSSAADDKKVREKLIEKYPSATAMYLAGTSVVYYSESTYNTVASYIVKLLLASKHVSAGKDQTKAFPKKNINIKYNDVPEGHVMTDTGIPVRADFKLALNIPKPTESESKNEMNMDYVSCYGYIDLAIVSEPMQMPTNVPNQYGPVQYVNKLSPTIVITYIRGASALPGYGMMGLVTSSVMMDNNMYFGFILNNIAKYQDIISLLLETEVNFAKMTPEQKVEILSSVLTAPAFAIDVPNNGYLEELNFLIPRATRDASLKTYASRFLKQDFVAKAIVGDVPVPLVEVFDKKLVDSRIYDAAKIASLTKNKSHAVAMSTYTNSVDASNADTSIANICDMIQEVGLDGTMAGTIARIFISQEGLTELVVKSEINATYNHLYTPINTGNIGAIQRAGYVNAQFHNPYQQGYAGRDVRAYQTY